MGLFSVVIPCYNCINTLEATVNSVQLSGLTDYEILLIDDGSNDGTGDLCDDLCQRYTEVRCVHQENAGVSAARNRGIDNANGEYLWFVDADDTVDSGALSHAVSVINRRQPDMLLFGISFDYYYHCKLYRRELLTPPIEGKISFSQIKEKSTHNRRERPVHGHRGGSRGRFYYRITTFEGRPWDARDPYKTTFMALKHEIRLSIWRKQKETPGVEKAPGVSSPQRKESGRSGRDDGELRFWVRPGHPYKAVTSISQAEALAHGLTHLHHLVFAAVLARELDWCAALQDAREDARPWGVVGIGLRSDVWVEVRRDDHRPAVLVT